MSLNIRILLIRHTCLIFYRHPIPNWRHMFRLINSELLSTKKSHQLNERVGNFFLCVVSVSSQVCKGICRRSSPTSNLKPSFSFCLSNPPGFLWYLSILYISNRIFHPPFLAKEPWFVTGIIKRHLPLRQFVDKVKSWNYLYLHRRTVIADDIWYKLLYMPQGIRAIKPLSFFSLLY